MDRRFRAHALSCLWAILLEANSHLIDLFFVRGRRWCLCMTHIWKLLDEFGLVHSDIILMMHGRWSVIVLTWADFFALIRIHAARNVVILRVLSRDDVLVLWHVVLLTYVVDSLGYQLIVNSSLVLPTHLASSSISSTASHRHFLRSEHTARQLHLLNFSVVFRSCFKCARWLLGWVLQGCASADIMVRVFLGWMRSLAG